MKRLLPVFLFAAAVLVFKLGSLPYLETSEARYAEISKEMVDSGDWITPRLLDIKHFHKPPLTYWLSAISFKIFGINNLSGRILLYLAALLILFFTAKVGSLLFPEDKQLPAWAVLILLSSLLFLVQARTLTTDIYLTLFVLMAVYWHWYWTMGRVSAWYIILSAASMGLAVLTKGHIPLMLTALPWFLYYLIRRDYSVKGWMWFLLYTGIVLVIALPWFVVVIHKNPGLLNYLFGFQIVQRATTEVHHRGGNSFYFIGVLLGGMFLWFNHFFTASFRMIRDWMNKRGIWNELLVFLYIIIPLIIFSLGKSKLPSYVLPLTPFVAIFLSRRIFSKQVKNRAIELNLLRAGLLISAAVFFTITFLPIEEIPAGIEPQRGWFLLPAASSVAVLVMSFVGRYHEDDRLFLGYTLVNILFFGILTALAPRISPDLNGYEKMARVILEKRQPDSRIISFQDRLPSLSFYTGMPVIQVEHDREVQFEDEQKLMHLKTMLFQSRDDLVELMKGDPHTFLVIGRKQWKKLRQDSKDITACVDTAFTTSHSLLLSTCTEE